MSRAPLHFRFAEQDFDEVHAHGARRTILTRRVLDEAGSEACRFVDLTVVPPGADIGQHTHAEDNEELYVIVSGEGEMEVDGVRIQVGPGDVVVNRPGGTHGLVNTGSSELRLVVVEVPVRGLP